MTTSEAATAKRLDDEAQADLRTLLFAAEILNYVKAREKDDIVIIGALKAAYQVFSRRVLPEV